MYCKNCGALLPDEAKFCPSCGEQVSYIINNESSREQINIPEIKANSESMTKFKFVGRNKTAAIAGLAFLCIGTLGCIRLLHSDNPDEMSPKTSVSVITDDSSQETLEDMISDDSSKEALDIINGDLPEEAVQTITVVAKEVEYDSDGSVSEWIEYEYDAETNMIKQVFYDADGSMSRWEEYEYDAEGNTTKYVIYITLTAACLGGLSMNMTLRGT